MGIQEIIIWPFPARAATVTTEGSADVEDFVVQFADLVMPKVARHTTRGTYQLVD
jgi:hypothetical protein